ncbi:DUF3307 domain-containing protein, partial [Candidatus Peregrinibacteria bacterium]|nr:DUF3307 domain-containing protein [Candidatus Peregrinibacteria bacterium]
MAFIYMVIAHILGDFVFQTKRLVELKAKHQKWLILHSLVQFLLLFILLSLLYPQNLVITAGFSLIIGVFHYCIDLSKILYLKKYKKPYLAFILDQIAHLIVITGIYLA